jgi:aerobic C4-dicarboxylate transport protein
MPQRYRHLYLQVLVAIFSGILLGYFQPDYAIAMKPLGDGFIKLIKMLIAPIIFCTVTTGIAGMRSLDKAGRLGLKALLYFEIVSTFALMIGLLVVHLLQPGAGMNIDITTLDQQSIAAYVQTAKTPGVTDFLLAIIPATLISAFVNGDLLQVLLISLLFGFSLAAMKETAAEFVSFLNKIAQALFGIVETLMKLAPIGAFGAMAFTVGKYGLASLTPLAYLMANFYLTCLLFVVAVLGLIARVSGFNILHLIRYVKDELWIVLGTSSSEAVLPRLMAKLERLGCSRPVVGLIIPAGYSFNLDGTAIYLTMASLFIAQVTNTELSIAQELTLLGILLLTSKGAAGVTGSGFITLAATLTAVPGIPVEGLALLLGIDRFMSEARALTNLIGNAVATIVTASWENELDRSLLKRELLWQNPEPKS